MLPVELKRISSEEAVRATGCKLLPIAAGDFFSLGEGIVLALDGADAALFFTTGAGDDVVSTAIEAARSAGAVHLHVVAPLDAPMPESLGKGREILTWQRTPEDGPLPDPAEKLEPAPFAVLEENFARWHIALPPWQRRLEAIERARSVFGDALRFRVIRQDGEITAYILYVISGGDVLVLDAAVDPQVGVVKAGRPPFQALYLTHQDAVVTAPAWSVEDPMNRVMVAMRYHVVARHREWAVEDGDAG